MEAEQSSAIAATTATPIEPGDTVTPAAAEPTISRPNPGTST
jgi:hypothetical protein